MSNLSRPHSLKVAPAASPHHSHDNQTNKSQMKDPGMNVDKMTKCQPFSMKSTPRPKSADNRRSYRDLGCIKSAPELPCFQKTFVSTSSDSEGEFVTISKPLSECNVVRKSSSSISETVKSSGAGFFNRLFSRSRSRERQRHETLETQCLLECVSTVDLPVRSDSGEIINHGRKVSDLSPTEIKQQLEVDVKQTNLEVKVHHYKSLCPEGSKTLVPSKMTSSLVVNRRHNTLPVASALRMCPTPPLAVFSSDEDITSVTQSHRKQISNQGNKEVPSIPVHGHGNHSYTHSNGHQDSLTIDHDDDILVVTRRCQPHKTPPKNGDVSSKQKCRVSYQGDMLIARPTIVMPDTADGNSNHVKPKTISPELEERISQLFIKDDDQMTIINRRGSKPLVLRSQSLQEAQGCFRGNVTAQNISQADHSRTTSLTRGRSASYSPSKVIQRSKYSRRKHYTIDFGSLPEAVGRGRGSGNTPDQKSTRRNVILRQTSLHSYFYSMKHDAESSDDGAVRDDSQDVTNKVVFQKISPCRVRSRKRSLDYLPYVSSLPTMALPVLHFDSQAPKPIRHSEVLAETRWARKCHISVDSQDDDDLLLEQMPLLMAEVASNDSGIQQDETPTSCESFKLQSQLETAPLLSPLRSNAESPRRYKRDRPKSDCLTVRWADAPDGSTLLPLPEYSLDGSTTQSLEVSTEVIHRASRVREKERPKSDLGSCPGLSDALQCLLRRNDQTSSSSLLSPEGSLTDSRPNLRNRRMSTPQPIRSRTSQSVTYLHSRCARLKKTHSAPDLLDYEEFGRRVRRKRDLFRVSLSTAGDLAVLPHDYSSDDDSEDSISYGAASMSGSTLSLRQQGTLDELFEDGASLTYAEALWDHVTMDTEELGFRAGDVIEVTDLGDRNWWYGRMGDKHGWFPAPFVRLRANQIEIITDGDLSPAILQHGTMMAVKAPLTHTESVSQSQARTNVVQEILHAEREYVRHLRDVIQGYVEKCRKRPEMFPAQKLATIFGNISAIYSFSIKILQELESHVNTEHPHLSDLGKIFLEHQEGFEIYSEYCNNHPTGCEELRALQKNKKYTHFFEACRLLQNMIELPLEGFLLTPVQKICKYPLQLRELLKYTSRSHSDHADVSAALEAMRRIAVMINERKRKMESLEKLSAWQLGIDDWQGPDLLEQSSELIYSGEMTKVNNSGWHQDRVFFLFDHQLIYCKKDLLWRDMLQYKGRIDLDNCVIKALPDDKDPIFNINVKNAIRIYDNCKRKWYLLYCHTPAERNRWFSAFQDERNRVDEDKKNGFNLAEFRQKAHLPQVHGRTPSASVRYREQSKKHKKYRGRHPKNNDKHKTNASQHALLVNSTEENNDTSHTKKWFNFGNRKTKN